MTLKTIQPRTDMETSTPTFDQLPHVVSGLSEKLDRVLDLLEKAGISSHSKQTKPSRRLVYAKETVELYSTSKFLSLAS